MRHHLGGEHLHVPLRQFVRQRAELQHGDELAGAGLVAQLARADRARSCGEPTTTVPLSASSSMVRRFCAPSALRIRMVFFIDGSDM